jgi:hypothetical protein
MSPPEPPGPPSHFTFRSLTNDSTLSTSSDYTSASSIAASTPASSVVAHSPAAAYPPTSSARIEVDQSLSIENGDGLLRDRVSVTDPVSIEECFRCTVDGCTAAPFQTQYLLNSHMNVHSNDRPHFCTMKDCPRGPGGLGFKRKNEMIR